MYTHLYLYFLKNGNFGNYPMVSRVSNDLNSNFEVILVIISNFNH